MRQDGAECGRMGQNEQNAAECAEWGRMPQNGAECCKVGKGLQVAHACPPWFATNGHKRGGLAPRRIGTKKPRNNPSLCMVITIVILNYSEVIFIFGWSGCALGPRSCSIFGTSAGLGRVAKQTEHPGTEFNHTDCQPVRFFDSKPFFFRLGLVITPSRCDL